MKAQPHMTKYTNIGHMYTYAFQKDNVIYLLILYIHLNYVVSLILC